MLMKIAVLILLLSSQDQALVPRPQPLVAKHSSSEIAEQLKKQILSGEVHLTCGRGSHG